MTSKEELQRQIRDKFGSAVVARAPSPIGFARVPHPTEPTLGDILRAAADHHQKVMRAGMLSKPDPDRPMPHQKDYSPKATAALTGGLTNYYLAKVTHPQRAEQPPYQAECEDIIHALGMTFDEGCLFKALWRNAAARKGEGKPGSNAVYETEKMVHYAMRLLKHAKDAR